MIYDLLPQMLTSYLVVIFLDKDTLIPLFLNGPGHLRERGLVQVNAVPQFLPKSHHLSGKGQARGLATVTTIGLWQLLEEFYGPESHHISPSPLFLLFKGLLAVTLRTLLRLASSLFLMTAARALESSHSYISSSLLSPPAFLAMSFPLSLG
jgi:hypothetical protein